MESLIDDNDIPEDFKLTISKKKFLQYDSGSVSNNRMVILFNNDFLPLIQASRTWLCDGTFKSSPKEFKQLFIIHCSLYERYLPMIYVLLPGKSFNAYNNMIIELKS